MSTPLMSVRSLSKSFGATPALRGADLDLAAGEVLAVIGPSGSGKSTLLHCMAGILRPDQGEVWYAGNRIDQCSERARSQLRRDQFGFVFQFGQLVPELSMVENVMLPLLLAGVPRRTAQQVARKLLDRLELTALATRRPGELSGGQAQRVAVARAMVGKPRIIFADEPTGALDSLTGERVMEMLVDAARGEGTAVVLVTHEARVAAYADREIVVRDGQVVALATV